jgi:hypothetical protein
MMTATIGLLGSKGTGALFGQLARATPSGARARSDLDGNCPQEREAVKSTKHLIRRIDR